MTLSAVQLYVNDLLQGTGAGLYGGTIESFITPPAPTTMEYNNPQTYVWGGTGNVVRATIPRATPGTDPGTSPGGSTGWKVCTYELSIWAYGLHVNGDPQADRKFPGLMWIIEKLLMMAEMPVELTDPDTGDQSRLMNLGESFRWAYDVDRTLADQRSMRNAAQIICSAEEMFQF